MKKALYIIPAAMMMTACASSGGHYMAADQQGDYGYYESELEENRYRVAYKSRGDNLERAKDYALLRASELTLQHGYDWFEIVDRSTDVKKDDRHDHGMVAMRVHATTYRECGVISCRTVTRPDYIDTAYANNRPRGPESTATIIEIVMGEGEKPKGGNVYDARTLANTIRERT